MKTQFNKQNVLKTIKKELIFIFNSSKGTQFTLSQINEELCKRLDDFSIDDVKHAIKELYRNKEIQSRRIEGKRYFYIDNKIIVSNIISSIFVLFVTLLLLFSIGELSTRIKYAKTGIYGSYYEKMEDDLYKQLTDETNPFRFVYGQSPRWDFDPDLGLVPKANFTYDVPSEIEVNETHVAKIMIRADDMNAQGMRQMSDVNLSKREGVYRIALLGDSFTVGDDVLTKHSFASQLTELIPDSEIVNVGMSGKSITYMYAAFVKKAEKYHPDMTIMNVLVDDLVRDRTGEPIFQQPYVFVDKNNSLEITNKYIFSYDDFLKEYKPPKFKSYFLTYLKSKISTMNYKERVEEHNLEMFGRIVDDLYNRTNGNFMVTLFLGWKPILSQDSYKYELYEKAKGLLNRKKIPYFDAVQYFQNEITKYSSNSSPEVIVDTFYQGVEELGHFSQLGYVTYANGLKDQLVKDGFYSGTTLNPYKFIYVPKQEVVAYLDENNDILHYVTSFDVVDVVPK